jgi:hypothetical protein
VTPILGRTPLDEGSARLLGNTHKRQTPMFPVGFEPEIPAREWPQTYALDRAATGIGGNNITITNNNSTRLHFLEYYAALSGSSVPTFRDNVSALSSRVVSPRRLDILTLEDGADMLSLNVGYAALSGSSVPTFRDNLLAPSSRVVSPRRLDFLTFKDGANRLSRNVGYAALNDSSVPSSRCQVFLDL